MRVLITKVTTNGYSVFHPFNHTRLRSKWNNAIGPYTELPLPGGIISHQCSIQVGKYLLHDSILSGVVTTLHQLLVHVSITTQALHYLRTSNATLRHAKPIIEPNYMNHRRGSRVIGCQLLKSVRSRWDPYRESWRSCQYTRSGVVRTRKYIGDTILESFSSLQLFEGDPSGLASFPQFFHAAIRQRNIML